MFSCHTKQRLSRRQESSSFWRKGICWLRQPSNAFSTPHLRLRPQVNFPIVTNLLSFRFLTFWLKASFLPKEEDIAIDKDTLSLAFAVSFSLLPFSFRIEFRVAPSIQCPWAHTQRAQAPQVFAQKVNLLIIFHILRRPGAPVLGGLVGSLLIPLSTSSLLFKCFSRASPFLHFLFNQMNKYHWRWGFFQLQPVVRAASGWFFRPGLYSRQIFQSSLPFV